ncbi:HAD family phosphatase [Paraflavitalea soli]|uniref:HAD family phosphatase n=1 Tax=Paraflavitalea soli TaxID=2315862 RepID=A0A3B7MQ28_9BACT|nr:HAD family phosphatase [Paraflavitalea soli]AXY76634.1 HAD family phosphatase [Paraflavitalea soli]
MGRIDTIVFDLGGVLVDWNPEYVYKTIFDKEEDMHWFFQNITTGDWNEEQDAGRSLAEGTALLVKQFPEHEANIRAFYGRWEEMLGGPIQETVDILHHLKYKTDYRLYALTNWSAETFPIALKRYDFLHWFEGIVVSGDEKTRKPFLPIYQTLLSRFNIDPATAVYTDDNVRNLHPAQELGLHTIHFQSPEQFKKDLLALGVDL